MTPIKKRTMIMIGILLLFAFSSGFYAKGAPDPSVDVIHLKEYFTTILNAHIRQDELRYQMQDRALALYAAETERRLEALNQLRGEVVTDRVLYLRRETYDASQKELAAWKDMVNQKLTAIETRSVTYISIIGVAFLIINLALAYNSSKRNRPPIQNSK